MFLLFLLHVLLNLKAFINWTINHVILNIGKPFCLEKCICVIVVLLCFLRLRSHLTTYSSITRFNITIFPTIWVNVDIMKFLIDNHQSKHSSKLDIKALGKQLKVLVLEVNKEVNIIIMLRMKTYIVSVRSTNRWLTPRIWESLAQRTVAPDFNKMRAIKYTTLDCRTRYFGLISIFNKSFKYVGNYLFRQSNPTPA